MAVFGPGSLYVTRNDIPNQTPVNIGYANEFSYDESADTKDLYGQNQYALVIARGTIKATGKMKAAVVSGLALNAVLTALVARPLWRLGEQTATIAALIVGVAFTYPLFLPFTVVAAAFWACTGATLQNVSAAMARIVNTFFMNRLGCCRFGIKQLALLFPPCECEWPHQSLKRRLCHRQSFPSLPL